MGQADERAAPRTRKPDRRQMVMLACSLDDALPPEHPARVIWQAVARLDLSGFYDVIEAREGVAGREPVDPPVLVSLWLLAAVEGVASGRHLARLCEHHAAYRWVCGGVSVNYHTLNDFRVGHRAPLDDLLTQVIARLTHAGLVSVERITQDGTKVRASASARSFKKRQTLERHLKDAAEQVAALGRLADESPSAATARQQANQQRVAEQRLSRVNQAMDELTKVEASKAAQKKKPSKEHPARASTTDPEARVQKMPDGGFRPAYNVQLAQDPTSRAVVGVAVAADGSDKDQAEPMRQQVEQRAGQPVLEHLIDGGYVSLANVDRAAESGVTLFAPVPEPRKEGQDRFAPRPDDSPAVAQWRQRMSTPEAQKIYQQRASTCETINADLKTHRGLGRLLVRSAAKVLCVATWAALAYNLIRFAAALTA
jgi:transposase